MMIYEFQNSNHAHRNVNLSMSCTRCYISPCFRPIWALFLGSLEKAELSLYMTIKTIIWPLIYHLDYLLAHVCCKLHCWMGYRIAAMLIKRSVTAGLGPHAADLRVFGRSGPCILGWVGGWEFKNGLTIPAYWLAGSSVSLTDRLPCCRSDDVRWFSYGMLSDWAPRGAFKPLM